MAAAEATCLRRAGLIGFLLIAVVVLGSACRQPPADVERPWASRTDIVVQPVELAHTTMSAAAVPAGTTSLTLPLGSLRRGVLQTAVGVRDSKERIVLDLVDAGSMRTIAECPIEPRNRDAGWLPCAFTVAKHIAAGGLRVSQPGGHRELFLAAPVWVPERVRSQPDVFVLLIDTVRADRLHTLNRAIPLGMALDNFAHDAITFEDARSSTSWTRPAVATLFTGLLGPTHGVLGRSDVLPAEFDTLAEILTRHGYETRAWSSNPQVLPLWGFAQGFDSFVDVSASRPWDHPDEGRSTHKADAAAVLKLVRSALPTGKEPVFSYIHLMDAHGPYMPDGSHLARISPDLAQSLPASAHGERFTYAKAQYPKYLAAILQMDEQIGAFFADLKRRGLYDHSLILVVGDHGEEFADHGDVSHGKTLYEEVLRVPVFLKLPGNALAGTRLPEPVGLSDLMPTVLQAIGLPVPAHLDGRGHLEGDRIVPSPADAPQFAVLKMDKHFLAAVADGGWKLIVNYWGSDELFDLKSDPYEQTNLLALHPAEAARLRGLLDQQMAPRLQGWHIRGCGGDIAAVLRFTLTLSAGTARSASFEADDVLQEEPLGVGGKRFRVSLSLAKLPIPQEAFGRVSQGLVRDEDELIVNDLGSQPSIDLDTSDGAPLRYAFGVNETHVQAAAVHLDVAPQEAIVRPSQAVECSSGLGRPEGPPASAYLRIWFVPPSQNVPSTAIDPSILERLHALGYVSDAPAQRSPE